jgi:hypothetical protein
MKPDLHQRARLPARFLNSPAFRSPEGNRLIPGAGPVRIGKARVILLRESMVGIVPRTLTLKKKIASTLVTFVGFY